MEIFDWLRGLKDGHELICLCDVYTYTTMISQCGSHQQLRRALELVAEMRSRGIACNVHTYSALMNVCIKANELDLALDVYKQLLSDSCTPNLVTYNTLIDVYGKTGQWEEAVKVLDALEHQVSSVSAITSINTSCIRLLACMDTSSSNAHAFWSCLALACVCMPACLGHTVAGMPFDTLAGT